MALKTTLKTPLVFPDVKGAMRAHWYRVDPLALYVPNVARPAPPSGGFPDTTSCR